MGGTPLAFTMPPEMAKQLGPRASELMGYLKELSDGRRLRGESGRMWPGGPGGMVSDNYRRERGTCHCSRGWGT